MFILLFVGGSLDYQKEILIFIKPSQATVMLSLYFAEALLAYATMPWGFNDNYVEQSLNLYFYVYIIIRGR